MLFFTELISVKSESGVQKWLGNFLLLTTFIGGLCSFSNQSTCAEDNPTLLRS